MVYVFNLAAIAVAGQATWKRVKPVIVQDRILLPALGFLSVILLWWFIATFVSELMPTPLEALVENLDYILNPFYQRGLGSRLRLVIIGKPKTCVDWLWHRCAGSYPDWFHYWHV